MSRLKQLSELYRTRLEPVKHWFTKLSGRERGLVLVSGVCLFFIAFYQIIWSPVTEVFAEQAIELSKTEEGLKTLPESLRMFSVRRARLKELEAEYKEIEITEGELSYLENLVKTKIGISAGHSIRDLQVKDFGKDYEQASFSVEFPTTELSKIVDFLTELTQGKKRMIVTELSINKTRNDERLEVEVKATSIRKKAGT